MLRPGLETLQVAAGLQDGIWMSRLKISKIYLLHHTVQHINWSGDKSISQPSAHTCGERENPIR